MWPADDYWRDWELLPITYASYGGDNSLILLFSILSDWCSGCTTVIFEKAEQGSVNMFPPKGSGVDRMKITWQQKSFPWHLQSLLTLMQ